jgi:predicted RNA-binding Zn-ribbon protein involved in translation (DUF1610 family)
MRNNYQRFLTACVSCGQETSKSYARRNEGKCKMCVTGVDQTRYFVCPDCGERRLTAYQKKHHYHCDVCTRNVEQSGGIYGF